MERIKSLDALRGITIAGMILVNSPGNSHAYAWLRHAPWNGWTPADFVFPGFLVIMGASLALSLGRRLEAGASSRRLMRRIAQRTLALFVLGLISNAVLYEPSEGFRIMGVLQRIALCYGLCAPLFLYSSRRARIVTMLGLLLVYWAITGNALDPHTNLVCRVDRLVLAGHMYAPLYDPEGLLGTLSATATTLMGVLTGEWIAAGGDRGRQAAMLTAGGLGAMAVGAAWSGVLALNKHLWTSSYAVFTGGMAIAAFGSLLAVIDVSGWRAWAAPLEVLGRNPLLSYVLAGIVYGALEFVHIKTPLCHALFDSWLAPRTASAAFACAIVVATWLPIAALDRKRLFLRL